MMIRHCILARNGINEQLEKLVLNCQLCMKYSKAKTKQAPNISLGQEVPIHPWVKVSTDIFHSENYLYLLIVDYTSRFPIVHKLNVQNSAASCKPNEINILRVWLARDHSIWQWTLLFSWNIHQADDRLQCEPYN